MFFQRWAGMRPLGGQLTLVLARLAGVARPTDDTQDLRVSRPFWQSVYVFDSFYSIL